VDKDISDLHIKPSDAVDRGKRNTNTIRGNWSNSNSESGVDR